MPSMRRSQSAAPTPRSAPYRTLALGPVSPSSAPAPARPRHPRRAASDSYTRRVLADIHWWTVTDGQHPHPPHPDHLALLAGDPTMSGDTEPIAPAVAVAAAPSEVRSAHPSVTDDLVTQHSSGQPIAPLMDQFAALSLAPRSPSLTRTRRSLSSSSVCSTVSVGSIPEQLVADLAHLALASLAVASETQHPHCGIQSFFCNGGYHAYSQFEDAMTHPEHFARFSQIPVPMAALQ